jgi:rod shape-determining protein MreB
LKKHLGVWLFDIGGGTTGIAVLSLGDIVIDNTIRIAGDE